MIKKIIVSMHLAPNGRSVPIDVSYTVEQENEMVTNYHCTIDMPAEEIPDELKLKALSVRKVRTNNVTSYSIVPHVFENTATALFAGDLAEQIRFRSTIETIVSVS
jgi:hypothetical protein